MFYNVGKEDHKASTVNLRSFVSKVNMIYKETVIFLY